MMQFVVFILLAGAVSSLAHSGGTDRFGGHNGPTGYHYHNGSGGSSGGGGYVSPYVNSDKTLPKPAPLSPPAPLRPITASEKAATAERTLAWHQELAAKGDTFGLYQMGLRYLKGDGVEQSCSKARELFVLAAKKGDVEAYVKVKNMDFCTELVGDNGRRLQSTSARRVFMVKSDYPHGRPGYVIVHIQALDKGGEDAPDNFKWAEAAKALVSERWEWCQQTPLLESLDPSPTR